MTFIPAYRDSADLPAFMALSAPEQPTPFAVEAVAQRVVNACVDAARVRFRAERGHDVRPVPAPTYSDGSWSREDFEQYRAALEDRQTYGPILLMFGRVAVEAWNQSPERGHGSTDEARLRYVLACLQAAVADRGPTPW